MSANCECGYPNFVYTTLSDLENSIRLLTVLPKNDNDNDDEQLRAVLQSFQRKDVPKYTPISYTWGTESSTSTLHLTGPELSEWGCFPIRPNLKALLNQVRSLPFTLFIWVDAICIDQNNIKEKGHQVRNMDKIYRGRELLVWLGEPSETSDLAIEILKRIEGVFHQRFHEKLSTSWAFEHCERVWDALDSALSRRALFELLTRPWFSRRWIVQEFVLAKQQVFWIGAKFSHFIILSVVAEFCLTNKIFIGTTAYNHDHLSENHHHLPGEVVDPLRRFSCLWKAWEVPKFHTTTSALTLEYLLTEFGACYSYDPRDAVYAFISMASDIDLAGWFPDYSPSNTTIHLYGKVVEHIIRKTRRTDIICTARASFVRDNPTHHNSSWIPWFGSKFITIRPGHQNSHIASDSPSGDTPDSISRHEIYGFNTQPLTTFGEPAHIASEQLRSEPVAICDGCNERGIFALYKCLDCDNIDFCRRCVHQASSLNHTDHRFRPRNMVYFASDGIPIVADDFAWGVATMREASYNGWLCLAGRVVDEITAVARQSFAHFHMSYEARGLLRRPNQEGMSNIPVGAWRELPGMDKYIGEDLIPSFEFFRIMTGNRMAVSTGEICLASLSWLQEGYNFLVGSQKGETDWPLTSHARSMKMIMDNRRLITTAGGFVGFAPHDAEVGHKIAIIRGCSVPVVLSHLFDSEELQTSSFLLKGECYIEGLMEGEYWTQEHIDAGFERIVLH